MNPPLRRPTLAVLLASAALLGGCGELLGIEPASAVAARKESEAKAIGAGCRHAGRAIEDCYALNRRIDKGGIFAGWREMNDYMRENKMVEVVPELAGPATPGEKVASTKGAGETPTRTGKH